MKTAERRARCAAIHACAEERRELILAHIAANPGTTFRGIVRATGIASGTVGHHVRVLKQRGLLRVERAGFRVYHFLATDTRPLNVVRVEAEPRLRHIHALLPAPDAPGKPQRDVLDACEWARSSTQHALYRLARLGVASYRRQGRYQVWNQAVVA